MTDNFTLPQSKLPIEEYRTRFMTRFALFILDIILLYCVATIIFFVTQDTVSPFFESVFRASAENMHDLIPVIPVEDIDTDSLQFQFNAISTIVSFLGILTSLLEIMTSASIAKILLGYRIRQSTGEQASLQSLLVRYGVKNTGSWIHVFTIFTPVFALTILSSLLGMIFTLGCFAAFSQSRMALHDILAKTAIFSLDDISDLVHK